MKILRFIHKWVGMLIGLFLCVLSLTGILLLIGKITAMPSQINSLIYDLHTSLLLGDVGSLIIGIVCLLSILELFTGYILWGRVAKSLIKSARMRGKSAWSGLRRSLSWKRPDVIWGMHVAGGFWCGIPVLLMILTGLTWCFGWYADIIFGIFGDNADWTLFHTIANLHTGFWCTPLSEILWIVSTDLCITLPVSGFLLFLRKLKKRK